MSGYKKILLISSEFPPGPGGIGNHAFNLAKYLNENNTEVKVLTMSDYVDKEMEEKFDAGINFNVTRFKRYKSRIKTYLERVRIISNTLKNETFTHIIFSGSFPLLASLLFKKYKKKIKFIAIGHGAEINSSNPVENFLVSKVLSNMDLTVPVSNYSKSKLTSGLDNNKITVIPNGFDLEGMDKINVKNKFLKEGELTLVTVGTFWPRKGHHNVLRALPEILKEHPGLKYNIVGRKVDLSLSKSFIEDSSLKNHINILGTLPNDEMYKVLNDSDIFILLSEAQASGDFEGFGIAVIEANYFGLPAIGSKDSGLEDAINNGVSGILVDPKNDREISQAIYTIYKDYSRFSEGARQWASEHHWSKLIKRYIAAIDKIN